MKKHCLLLILLMSIISEALYSQTEKGKICFIRPGSYTGAAVSFHVFINDSLVCKLKNKSYSLHTMDSGDHTVSGQGTGITLDKGSKPFNVKVEEGKTTYISVISVSNKVICEEITENSARELLKGSKTATNCGDNAIKN